MWKYIEDGSITSVPGIKAAGIHCGLKKRKKDLALIVSEKPCTAAGTYTLNKVQAAPIQISKKITGEGKNIKAVLVNSGNANACTGLEGHNDALESQKFCAEMLGIDQEELLVSSTGVIGERINLSALKKGIREIIPNLNQSGGIDAAEAIMTTDLKSKHFALKQKTEDGMITLGGICKGSGMIMPNMATMLAFIATDAKIENSLLQKTLSHAVAESFNKISVDGETSTNDMVILMANGESEIEIVEESDDYILFKNALLNMTKKMAKSIAADGEGATKLISITVKNAKSENDANTVAKALANSPLVKTAINGSDANWGRIISSAGSTGADFNPEDVSISFGQLPVLEQKYKVVLDEAKAKEALSKKEIAINLNLNSGSESSTWWTCDYSENYIKINASYRT